MLSSINLPPKVIEREMNLLFTPIKFGESGVVMCYPTCKQSFNLVRYLTYKDKLKKILGKYHNKYVFISLYLDSEENEQTFLDKLKNEAKHFNKNISMKDNYHTIFKKIITTGKDPYLFIFDAHSVKKSQLNNILKSVHNEILSFNKVGALIFFEENIYKDGLSNILAQYSKFLRNTIIIPSYSREETSWYLKSLSKEWKIKLSDKTMKDIMDHCYGFLWLLREIVRLIKMTNNTKVETHIENPSIKLRMHTLSKMLTQEEREALSGICFNDTSPPSEDYLLQVGLIKKDRNKYSFPIQFYKKYLKINKSISKLRIDNNKIILNDKDTTHSFTRQEIDVLKILFINKASLVSRDEIAKSIWKSNYLDRYSDWAIDKLMWRLRTTITELGLPKNAISTIKGRGFIFDSL